MQTFINSNYSNRNVSFSICFKMFQEFGKTPKYLVQRRRGLEYSKEMFEKSKEEQKLIPLSEQEKTNLVEVCLVFK